MMEKLVLRNGGELSVWLFLNRWSFGQELLLTMHN